MTYGAETWALTIQAKNKLAAAQTKMERSMLRITYRDRTTNIWVREKTKLNKSKNGRGHGQGTSAGYEITDGHCVSPPGNPTKEKTGETVERRPRRLLAEDSAR